MSYNQQKLDSQSLFDYLHLGQEMAVNIATSFADTKHNQFSTDSDWNQIKERLIKNMTDLTQFEQTLNNCIKASTKTEQKIQQLITDSENSAQNKSNISVNKIFAEDFNEIVSNDNTKVEDNNRYKKLMEIFEEFNSRETENDDELMAMDIEEERIPIDPFSKTEIEDPVKNTKCGHIYDRQQLTQVLNSMSGSARLRCAYVGCNNRSITLDDVVVDHKIRALIHKLKRNQQN